MRRRDEYGQLTGLCSPWLDYLRLRHVVRYIPQGSSILEVGCGRAGILRYRHHHPRYVGPDIIPEIIERDRSRYPQYEFHLLNVEEENVASLGEFDVVLLLAVLQYFSRADEVMRKVKALLKAGGRIIVTTPHPRGERVLEIGFYLGLCSPESHGEHQSLLGREELHRMATHFGLCVMVYKPFLFGMNQLLILRG